MKIIIVRPKQKQVNQVMQLELTLTLLTETETKIGSIHKSSRHVVAD